MSRVYVGVGSNIDPEANIPAALRLMHEQARIDRLSTFHVTPPIGSPDSPAFYNGVARVETDLGPRELKFGVLREIETALGRKRGSDRYAPRTVDLDILLYGDTIIEEPDLAVPDPDIFERDFVARCILEIEPDLMAPGSQEPLKDIYARMPKSELEPLSRFTNSLREEFACE